MKPFNLEQAKAGKPIYTQGGQEFKFIAHVPETTPPQIVCVGGGYIRTFLDNTSALFMASVKRVVWVIESTINQPGARKVAWTYENEQDAKSLVVSSGGKYIGPFRLEIEE